MTPHRPPRFVFLDGLRGVAALVVVLYHLIQAALPLSIANSAATHRSSIAIQNAIGLTDFALTGYGPEAVAVFIVLSGFCLMLPVMAIPEHTLQGGFSHFVLRRARRILPPYYAALLLAPILWLLVPSLLRQSQSSYWQLSLPANTPYSWLTHILLLHNWTRYDLAFDPPLWSIALEWQLYFLFALLLLPVFRRFGARGVVFTALVLSALAAGLLHLLHAIDPVTPTFSDVKPWMVLCFAAGMLTANVFDRTRQRTPASLTAPRRAWRATALALGLLFALQRALPKATFLPERSPHHAPDWLAGLLVAALTSILILECCLAEHRGEPAPYGTRFLVSPWAVRLGAFSYSLYLVHAYMLWLTEALLLPLRLAPVLFFAGNVVLGLALSLTGGYLFHLAFERPFSRLPPGRSPLSEAPTPAKAPSLRVPRP